jgi:hypothetical protein
MTRSVRERRAAVIGIRVMTLVSVADFYASCDVMRMPQHRGAAARRPRESEWRKIKNKKYSWAGTWHFFLHFTVSGFHVRRAAQHPPCTPMNIQAARTITKSHA